ncbi:hypothetical protein EST38_g14033 [Candolleomyces aberdarensis]|uniref:Uncharacterized protein n=1 Tax=Candolleomyces aberdarensis TaxID=2316362 RepID=A0A4Q2CZH4_9AGAR|nr:hypothetical protein EST38_g14033 [Candolleomyces aberdarensis]
MRYHWGLGVGHRYSHSDAPITNPYGDAVAEDDQNSGDSDSEIFDDDENEDSGTVPEAASLEVPQTLNPDIDIDEEANLCDGEVPADYIASGYDHRPNGSPHDTQLDLQSGTIEEAGELGTDSEGYDSEASIYGLHDRQEELPDDSGDKDEDDMYVEDIPEADSDSSSDEDAL